MNIKERTLFLAYIACLIICIILNAVSSLVPGFTFSVWNRVIVAATVSTVFFCLADTVIQTVEIRKYFDLYNSPIKQKAGEIKERLVDLDNTPDFIKRAAKQRVKEIGQRIKELTTGASDEEPDKKTTHLYVLNFLGFSSFLLIILVDPIYNWFIPSQGVLTMTAFVIVLVTAIYRDATLQKYISLWDKSKALVEKQELAVAMIELYEKRGQEDGENEDADEQSGK